jgi:pyrimidine-specific ribonucleoside hydrolase
MKINSKRTRPFMYLNRIWIFYCALVLAYLPSASAHEQTRTAVIVDTDVALDDIRALVLLLESEAVDVIAVVTSDGACSPSAGVRNIRTILAVLGREDIPAAAGETLGGPAPPWRPMSEALGWSGIGAAVTPKKEKDKNKADETKWVSAVDLIANSVKESPAELIYLCFGALTNLAAVLEAEPSLASRLEAVYYSGTAPEAEFPSWNTARDLPAARTVFDYPFPVYAYQLSDDNLLRFDTGLMEAVCTCGTGGAALLCELHGQEKVLELVRSGHFGCWDETVVIGFLYPAVCTGQSPVASGRDKTVDSIDRAFARVLYLNLLSGDMSAKAGHRRSVVLRNYPTDPRLLRDDVGDLAGRIIARHGLEEWNAAVLANELHRHLGIYSILGVKMGIRAREILQAGVDELRVTSRAGSTPPLSCLTDGLQVATGASLGRGTIAVTSGRSTASAVFSRGKKQVVLQLKPKIAARIRADIETAVADHGALTEAYWKAVRDLALGYWLEMDRREVFIELPE